MTALQKSKEFQYADMLFFIGGASFGVISAVRTELLEYWRPINIMVSIMIGGMGSLLFNNIFAGILSQTGKWFKGTGNTQQVKLALGWSMPPIILLIPLSLFPIVLADDQTRIGLTVVLQILMSIYSFGITIGMLSIVHKHHWSVSMLNFVLGLIILWCPIILYFGIWSLMT